jgi:hypothetical protein
MFENMVLKKMSEPEREDVTGGWREEHNEELLNLYSSLKNILMAR